MGRMLQSGEVGEGQGPVIEVCVSGFASHLPETRERWRGV